MVKVSTVSSNGKHWIKLELDDGSQQNFGFYGYSTSNSTEMSPLSAEHLITELRKAINSCRQKNLPKKSLGDY